jgi:hypothetical protein
LPPLPCDGSAIGYCAFPDPSIRYTKFG